MSVSTRKIVVLGSTGSIGCNTLEVIRSLSDRFEVLGLSAHSNLDLLVKQAQEFRPRWIVATDQELASSYDWSALPSDSQLVSGPDGLSQLAIEPSVDVVVGAIVGSAGLPSILDAVRAGKMVALANKEALVVAGSLVMAAARECGAQLLPVDSEHSAIFQALKSGQASEVDRIILTASGGPFRTYTQEQLKDVNVEAALAHPTWDMGPKITVDSATMMNKALELIEARWMFQMPADRIDIVVHPQSIVHSLVEYVDGSVLAQMSPPDMKLPIQYALTYPERVLGPAERLDLTARFSLEFEPPDEERFPALRLGRRGAELGGTAGAVLNAANEAAVASFLDGQLRFHEIPIACEAVLNQHTFDQHPTLEDLMRLDRWSRQEINTWVCSS